MSTRKRSQRSGKADEAQLIDKRISLMKQKVFIFNERLLETSKEIHIHRLFHPGKETSAYFILLNDTKEVYEIMEFTQPQRSWLINENLCSNGKSFITVPIDVTFLVLHYLRKFCTERAIQLHQIVDENHAFVSKFLSDFTNQKMLENVADVRTSLDIVVYKYNHKKTLAWLALKTRNLVERLRRANVYCGFSSVSANYAKSEKNLEQSVDEADYLKNACGIVGNYLDAKLYKELMEYLQIPEDEPIKRPIAGTKRKSAKLAITSPDLDENSSKKIKLENIISSPHENQSNEIIKPPEKKVNAREKALAKAASGTKSISSFFKK